VKNILPEVRVRVVASLAAALRGNPRARARHITTRVESATGALYFVYIVYSPVILRIFTFTIFVIIRVLIVYRRENRILYHSYSWKKKNTTVTVKEFMFTRTRTTTVQVQ